MKIQERKFHDYISIIITFLLVVLLAVFPSEHVHTLVHVLAVLGVFFVVESSSYIVRSIIEMVKNRPQ